MKFSLTPDLAFTKTSSKDDDDSILSKTPINVLYSFSRPYSFCGNRSKFDESCWAKVTWKPDLYSEIIKSISYIIPVADW